MNIAMTVAGSDSGGGAGIQADLKTFQELGVFGTSAVTALTAQNTHGVEGILPATPDFVAKQIEAVLTDMDIVALKTGMLFSAPIIEAVAGALEGRGILLVIDPVMIAKGGENLLEGAALESLKTKLLPHATVCTPNIPEAEAISGIEIHSNEDIKEAAKRILELGVDCVVMKGGHLEGEWAIDQVYLSDGGEMAVQTPRLDTKDTHGTGCTFSAAITAHLANGLPIREAIIEAKKFVHLAIATPLCIGGGHGPTNHFAYRQKNGDCEVVVDGTE
ncbi:MAG: bifunctional hydroxymethylpyrimidine kinase/phosphomethylpyrimidine kinase [Bacillus sp. (in: firmicutes)]